MSTSNDKHSAQRETTDNKTVLQKKLMGLIMFNQQLLLTDLALLRLLHLGEVRLQLGNLRVLQWDTTQCFDYARRAARP